MNLSGLVLELLLPGSIIVASFFTLASEFLAARLPENNWFTLFAFLTISYLIGVISRHTIIIGKPRKFYIERLNTQWPIATKALCKAIGSRITPDAMDLEIDGRTPRFPLSPENPLTEAQGSELVSFLRDSALNSGSSALWEHVNYQWNAARIARNCHLPALLLSAALTSCAIHQFSICGHWSRAIWFLAGC